jgi:hypothetical protein
MSEIEGLVSFAVLVVLLISRIFLEPRAAKFRLPGRQLLANSLSSMATTEQDHSLIRS